MVGARLKGGVETCVLRIATHVYGVRINQAQTCVDMGCEDPHLREHNFLLNKNNPFHPDMYYADIVIGG